MSRDPVTFIGESQQHVDNQKDAKGVAVCSAGSSQVTHDVSDAVKNSGGVDISVVSICSLANSNKELAPHNQELSEENIGAVDRRITPSVDVSSGYRAHDVDSNKLNESCVVYCVPSKTRGFVEVADGILSADVGNYSAPTTRGREDTVVANNDHTIVRNRSEIGYCGGSRGSCGNSSGNGEGSFDVETSSQSQPRIVPSVNKSSQSATVIRGVTSSESNVNTSGVPTVNLRKVRKRKSDGHYNDLGVRRRSSRLRSMSSNETSCPLSSGPDTQDMLLSSKVGTTPADMLSNSSRHALQTGTLNQSQSSVEDSHGRRAGGAKRGRKYRKAETLSREYNTRFIIKRNSCSQEPSKSMSSSSSQWSSTSARSLMPDVGLLLSSPSMVNDVYFSLPDDEYGALKLQIAKQKALCQSNGSPCDLATKTDSQVSDPTPSTNSWLKSEEANPCIETKQIADVKSDVIIEQQDNIELTDAGLGVKCSDHQDIVQRAQKGALVTSIGPLLPSDNSPIMSRSLQGARHCRNLPPKTRSHSQGEAVARKIDVRVNKSSRQRKNARSFAQTTTGSSQEDIFQSDHSSGRNSVQTRRNISQNTAKRDASVAVDIVCKEGQLRKGVVPQLAVVTAKARTVVDTCDSISHTEVAHVAASVCNVQQQKEPSLSSGTCPYPSVHEHVSTMHAEEDEVPHPSIASSCTLHRNVASVDTAVW